ncbi:hypothetical protein [Castellaniella sp.]|uniref:hypothetical protein n=1 Tax=Castellaniella sp. TaxID=1955812 RepID=UPI002AFEBABE|nr:hypothetical protein [Castellaniella sp.]
MSTISSNFPNAHQSIEPHFVNAGKIKTVVLRSRKFCQSVLPAVLSQFDGDFPLTLAYGGDYFSPLQALELDALRNRFQMILSLKMSVLRHWWKPQVNVLLRQGTLLSLFSQPLLLRDILLRHGVVTSGV